MKKFISAAIPIFTLLLTPFPARALLSAGASASLKSDGPLANQSYTQKMRLVVLESYLKSQASPLAPYSADFIEVADEYGLDWRLLPAIAGVESSFGKRFPQGSYNVFGWGIYGNQVLRFNSYREAMEAVAKGLTEKYPKEALTDISLLGRIYNGVTPQDWTRKIISFMDQIKNHPTPVSTLEFAS